jgi:hypothetical protein
LISGPLDRLARNLEARVSELDGTDVVAKSNHEAFRIEEQKRGLPTVPALSRWELTLHRLNRPAE